MHPATVTPLARRDDPSRAARLQASHVDILAVKLPAVFLHRFRWLNLPGVLLVALLQRTPALRVVTTTESLTASPVGAVVRSAFATIASLGAVHALAGATQFVMNRPSPINETVGQAIVPVFFTYTGTPAPPASFRITGALPPGLIFVPPATPAGFVNSSTPYVTGTPTSPGSYTIRVQGYNNVNGTGETNNELVPIVFNIAAGSSSAPTFSRQPESQSVTVGASVTFTASASGVPTPTYQWRRDGASIPDATTSSLTLSNVQPADAGGYSVLISNSAGSVTSNTASLTVGSVTRTARLSNLSVRTAMGAGQTLIVGLVVNDGSRDILVRAAGPALAAFGLSSAMLDPRLELYNGSTLVLSNNDWSPALEPIFASVGAFGFAADSKDAAFVQGLNAAYSIQAVGTGPGVVLVEAYDTGAASAARLVNVSARNRVGTGDDILIAGFNISGSGSKRLLIRAVGPKLSVFGVPGVLADPKLEVFDGAQVRVNENDNWSVSLAATFDSVGAFQLDGGSRDAALVATLPPGSYTAQVRGADGGTGESLIEIYELP